MFDRFIRLARARKAQRDERFEDALQLALDPLIAGDRRAEEIARAAGGELLVRARQRLEQGDLAAARRLADRVRAGLGDAAVASLRTALDAAAAGEVAERQTLRQVLADAKVAVDAGELVRAEAALAAHARLPESERRQLAAAIAERRGHAARVAAEGERRLGAGDVEGALEDLARAELLDHDAPAVVELRADLAERGAAGCAAAVRDLLVAGELASALARHRGMVAALPALRTSKPVQGVAAELADAVRKELRGLASLPAAAAFARLVRDSELPLPEPTAALVEALQAWPLGPTGGPVVGTADLHTRAALLAAAAAVVGALPVAEAAREQARHIAAEAERLAGARSLVDRGELDAARARLTEILADQPLHEAARRELELLDESVVDLERRLAEARTALRSGRLRQACTLALALGGAARVGVDAQQIVTQARATMALVDRGLDEVRVALHGRATATQEGLRHCLKRLEELAKVQTDHADLPAVVAAVEAEIEAVGVAEQAGRALDRGGLGDVLQACARLLALRPQLLAPERLEARLCDLADRVARFADVALAAGRLADVERCAAQFADLQVVRPEFGARAAQWRAAADERRAAAAAAVEQARVRLAARDLAEAERLVEAARLQWVEGDAARTLAGELRQLRQQSDALTRVEGLARERDFQGAQQKLAAMPTSPLLRTRIYDMKQNLARAQGLEGAFLLRVDEGGEQLVLRGESVTIGNVRQLRADLPVLANLAGRHATIRRSMSFHGGMQDTIVAEEGDVRIGGSTVAKGNLAPGDRVQLGPALGFVYQRPTSRSLTAGIVLQSGFQVAGTDRVLLMKDRGRDGRILLGPGADVHVRVARATGEVEIFASSSGQMRVACAQGGTIDGVPFTGEHPLAAGQMIEAAGITFHLLPWRPAA